MTKNAISEFSNNMETILNCLNILEQRETSKHLNDKFGTDKLPVVSVDFTINLPSKEAKPPYILYVDKNVDVDLAISNNDFGLTYLTSDDDVDLSKYDYYLIEANNEKSTEL